MAESGFTLTSRQVADVQTALRRALGLEPQRFSVRTLIGLVSSEVEQLRATGKDDASIANLIATITGEAVTAELIDRHFVTSKDRGFLYSERGEHAS